MAIKVDKERCMPAVMVDGLQKAFGATTVLTDVAFTVHTGDVYAFLGPNGSGKTTTMRVVLGLLQPDAGNVSVLGLALGASKALRYRVNALPESHGLYGWMSALHYLRFFGQLYGQKLSPEACRERLHHVGLEAADQRPIATFSRGMQQRLGLARALVNDPEVLFLDEPTNGLDPRGRRDIHNLLLTLNRERHMTIVLCTHILDDVARLCNRLAILYDGTVRYEGPLPLHAPQQGSQLRVCLETPQARSLPWDVPGITVLAHQGNELICRLQGITPAQALKALVERDLPIAEVEPLTDALEALYLRYTTGDKT